MSLYFIEHVDDILKYNIGQCLQELGVNGWSKFTSPFSSAYFVVSLAMFWILFLFIVQFIVFATSMYKMSSPYLKRPNNLWKVVEFF
jgi:hypothetical protein